ncbi:MAG TPA: XkdW family protein [Gammaproteobacteria bacterium]|nr:XkdW family protein [Gammaproteobacteria bacterium]
MDKGVTNIAVLLLILVCFWIFFLWKNSRKLNSDIKHVAQQHSLIRHDDRVRTLCRAIHLINPNVSAGVDFVIRHNSPDQDPVIAQWNADAPRPTDEQIKTALKEIASAYHEQEYADMRRAEYPSMEDQLEAAYEARQGNNARQLEVDEKIRRVREKYPKSDECG